LVDLVLGFFAVGVDGDEPEVGGVFEPGEGAVAGETGHQVLVGAQNSAGVWGVEVFADVVEVFDTDVAGLKARGEGVVAGEPSGESYFLAESARVDTGFGGDVGGLAASRRLGCRWRRR
jgi:hypothetical protein